ncbi:hypothetical protein B7494_g3757 [Chlorociboria aeruginascens]|nr:hypothetical protein B7494_g3757 [Chlorociboria aeruginascens]
MSLHVALQSVAFYVLSCSSCAKISHRRKAKQKAKRERVEKEELETEQPGLYRHPSPFSTNPYWTEEILMGPGPLKQKGDKGSCKNPSQRALNTAGPGSSYASSGGATSPTEVTEGSRISGDGWNRLRYQREDEDLWGHDTQGPGQRIMDAIAKAGSSAGRLLESKLIKSSPIKEENLSSYYLAKNPPVNDLHPPVVSTQPTSKEQTRWMLQPPPSAKIMEGKERVKTSRADSDGSSRKNDTPMSRHAPEKHQKLLPNDTLSLTTSTSKTSTSTLVAGQRHERSRSLSFGSSDSSDGTTRRKHRPPTLSISTPEKKARDIADHLPTCSASTEMRERPSRPILSTIVSSSNVVPHISPLKKDIPSQGSHSQDTSYTPSPSKTLSSTVNSTPASSVPSVGSKFLDPSHGSSPPHMSLEHTESICHLP